MNNLRSLKQYLRRHKLLWLTALALCISACATDFRQHVFHSIVIKNVGKDRIFDVYIDYGHPYRIEKKMIPPNAQTLDGGDLPIPVRVRASWNTSEGKRIDTTVELKKYLEYATRLRAVELWINDETLEIYQATPRGAREEFTDLKRIYPR